MADHPLVIGYQENNSRMLPLFKETIITTEKQIFVNTIHEIILSYVEEIAKTDILNNHNDELKRYSISNSVTFFSVPKVCDVMPLTQLQTSNDQNESTSRPVARKIKLRELGYYFTRFLRMSSPRDFSKGFEWREGSIAISNPIIKLVFWLFNVLKETISTHKPLWVYRLWFKVKGKNSKL
jgi:hypothetical protein